MLRGHETIDASNAVDDRKSNLSVPGDEVSSAFNETAIWWVNLTSINHITIYVMTDNEPWGNVNQLIIFPNSPAEN